MQPMLLLLRLHLPPAYSSALAAGRVFWRFTWEHLGSVIIIVGNQLAL